MKSTKDFNVQNAKLMMILFGFFFRIYLFSFFKNLAQLQQYNNTIWHQRLTTLRVAENILQVNFVSLSLMKNKLVKTCEVIYELLCNRSVLDHVDESTKCHISRSTKIHKLRWIHRVSINIARSRKFNQLDWYNQTCCLLLATIINIEKSVDIRFCKKKS